MVTVLRTFSAILCVLILLGPENHCCTVQDLWSQLRLHVFGVHTYCFWDVDHFHQCDITRTGPELIGASGWYTFLLLRSSGVLLLLGSTALITRNASTIKVLSGLTDRLAVVLRVCLQLALSLDLLHLTSTWASAPAAAAVNPAGPALYSPQHLLTGTFLLNQVLFFSQNPLNELCAGVAELLLLCCNLLLLHTNSSNSGAVSVNSFCSSSAWCIGSSTNSPLAQAPLTQWHANSSSSSSNSSLAKLLLIAVLSRLLLPLLASRAHLLLSCSSDSNISNTAQSASASRSRGSQGLAHSEGPSAAAAAAAL